MIPIKTDKEIKLMQEGGRRLKEILQELISKIKPGITSKTLNKLAENLIKKQGGEPSFKMVKDYNWAACICINDAVVHGVPNNKLIRQGDIVSVDIGMYYKGYHTDTAWTKYVQTANPPASQAIALRAGSKQLTAKVDDFLKVGELALKKAILMAKAGNRVGHISKTIQQEVESAGFNVVRTLVGHGIGKELHEKPEIPCFLKKKIKKTIKLSRGMVLAIEVMYAMGSAEVFLDKNDGWTIKTKDGKMSGHFEKTVAVASDGHLVLT